MPKGGGKVVSKIEARAHEIIGVPESQGEPLQVLRYEEGQKYDAHHGEVQPRLLTFQVTLI